MKGQVRPAAKSKRQAKDKYHRNAYARVEVKRLFLKSLISNEFLPLGVREQAHYSLLRKNCRLNRVENRCLVSHRSRAVYRTFKLARSQFHKFAGAGILPGIRRSSW